MPLDGRLIGFQDGERRTSNRRDAPQDEDAHEVQQLHAGDDFVLLFLEQQSGGGGVD